MSVLYGLLGISLLIFLHELGHFAAARLCRLPVLTFAIGFGPALLKFRRGGTLFRLNLLPLGGYVSTPAEETRNASPGVRLFYYSAGVLMNMGTAIVFLTLLFTCTEIVSPDGMPWLDSIGTAFLVAFAILREGFANFFHLLTGALSFEQLQGPLSVIEVAGEATSLGFAFTLFYLAFLSIQLAVLNLLPIPSLDGSHLVFLLLEVLRRGKKVPMEKEALVHLIGVIALFMLMVVITVREFI